MQEHNDASSMQQRRQSFPLLAPREPPSPRDRSSESARLPRLSHRSRAGCWTCRQRKVKCDEVHPKCGPCTRLSRSCDWDLRWSFSDSTSHTQGKYLNVTTVGNAVWDPRASQRSSASPISPPDDLPPFITLTTDEERERKAETQLPGTYGVVITPESFDELYPSSSRRLSLGPHLLVRDNSDPNIVLLERFEDASSPNSSGRASIPSPFRRSSLPNGLAYRSIAKPPSADTTLSISPPGLIRKEHEHLVLHFRQYVVGRLVQPELERATVDVISLESTRDVFEIEAARFEPLHHAICALSTLNLAYNGRSTIEDAMQHYHKAISARASTSSTDDLLSDGVFLSHFLLFVYDICIPTPNAASGANMWAIHLQQLLQRTAILRQENLDPTKHGYIIWTLCELDMYACLLGSGSCDFFQSIVRSSILPPLEEMIPQMSLPLSSGRYLDIETAFFPTILTLYQGVLIQSANVAQVAKSFRDEAAMQTPVSTDLYAKWQVGVSQLQNELSTFWFNAQADLLGIDNSEAIKAFPDRVRYFYEIAFTLYQSAVIYSRTSMFPGQRIIAAANQHEVLTDTEHRISSIIALATAQLEAGHLERRKIVFPVFMAGVATTQSDIKVQALSIIKALETTGIGQNTSRTRQLLTAVYEEQAQTEKVGGRMEDVDWLIVARERSLTVVNCGL